MENGFKQTASFCFPFHISIFFGIYLLNLLTRPKEERLKLHIYGTNPAVAASLHL